MNKLSFWGTGKEFGSSHFRTWIDRARIFGLSMADLIVVRSRLHDDDAR